MFTSIPGTTLSEVAHMLVIVLTAPVEDEDILGLPAEDAVSEFSARIVDEEFNPPLYVSVPKWTLLPVASNPFSSKFVRPFTPFSSLAFLS